MKYSKLGMYLVVFSYCFSVILLKYITYAVMYMRVIRDERNFIE